MYTLPLMPLTVPVDEYCQMPQSVHGAAMFGHAAVVYCACHSIDDVRSGPPTLSRQK
jgi:hypothetical protein